jgi:aquaporin Z
MHKYLTEFIGTFFLVLTIGLTSKAESAPATLGPFAIGSVLMVMVYMGGHISGAHYNPAVSLAALLRGALKSSEFIPYLVAQLAGALAASLVVYVMLKKTFAPARPPDLTVFGALLVEILYTFALALVVLNVATAKKTSGNSFYGLAIGFTVAAGAVAAGPVSGGAFNPAVGVGPTVVDAMLNPLGTYEHLWLYLVGPFAGAALAAYVFNFQENAANQENTTKQENATNQA